MKVIAMGLLMAIGAISINPVPVRAQTVKVCSTSGSLCKTLVLPSVGKCKTFLGFRICNPKKGRK